DTTALGNYVFDDCVKLEGITLPQGLSAVGEQLFCDCESLTYIKIPERAN
ncbi:MAG: leucine-rich repeat protein, partial [Clostridia bacterium]|nr:leucine-rich repeat protein [Clostridia bacterium]